MTVLGGKRMEKVGEFKYMEIVLLNLREVEKEKIEKVLKGRNIIRTLARVMKGRNVSIKVKRSLRYFILLLPLTYESDLDMEQGTAVKVWAVEMSYLWGMWSVKMRQLEQRKHF